MSLSHVVESLVLHNSNGGNVGYLLTGSVYCTRTRSICLFQYGNPNSNPNPNPGASFQYRPTGTGNWSTCHGFCRYLLPVTDRA